MILQLGLVSEITLGAPGYGNENFFAPRKK